MSRRPPLTAEKPHHELGEDRGGFTGLTSSILFYSMTLLSCTAVRQQVMVVVIVEMLHYHERLSR